jgi:hypothetical protein
MKGSRADKIIKLVRHLTDMRHCEDAVLIQVAKETWRPVLFRLAALRELMARTDVSGWAGYGQTYPVRKRLVRAEYNI